MMRARCISRRCLRFLLLAAALACPPARFSKATEDDVPVDSNAADAAPLIANNPSLLKIKKGIAMASVPDRSRLDEILSWKIEDIDLACQLTNGEKEKLRLAGQGDIKRFLERAHELEVALQSVSGPPQIDNVIGEWDSLKRLMTSGIFEDGSLFVKTRRQILTAEQIMKLETAKLDTSSAWMKDLQEAQALAARLDRPVLLHFSAKWCVPSQKLERVMECPTVMRVLRRKFVLVSVDLDQNPELARNYNINTIPCELVVNTAGDVLCRSVGLKDELEFLHSLHFVKNEPGQKPEVPPAENRTKRAE